MAEQILIIGLGHFGMSLAKTLSDKGVEVLAVDYKKHLVEEAAAFVTEAVIIDATDEFELKKLEPSKRDAVVCAIGDDSKDSSIICTALLRQMGAKLIISRANDKIHRRILKLVGAHQIINPEEEFGKRFANRLLYRKAIVETALGEDLQLTEISIQPKMIGKTLIELALPKKYGIMVVGIRDTETGKIAQPKADEPLDKNINLIIVSNEHAIPKLLKD
ncbi:MAG: TrkA family potassium uptake protein [Candidatus Delongbacteria bacterium]|nr:TrkA family potassium uptake protein [Candidatus Delongbacteria bacterium]MBN2835456.1 TrkA family potassium uptake protein [Candidatus Delongbacteria bacterium]